MTPEDVALEFLTEDEDDSRWEIVHAQVKSWVEKYGDDDE